MYKNKNFMTPKEFMAFGAEVVPLLRFGKYVWTDGEEFTGRLEVSNYGSDDLDEAVVEYEIACNGKVVQKGTTRSTDIPKGGNTSLGTLRQRLEAGTIGQKYEIRVRIKGTDYRNSWQVWCYPQPGKPAAVADGSVVQTDRIDRALEALKAGRRVLLYASKLGEKGNTRYASFAPVFWSATGLTVPRSLRPNGPEQRRLPAEALPLLESAPAGSRLIFFRRCLLHSGRTSQCPPAPVFGWKRRLSQRRNGIS